jgi:hypothetical protein
VEVSESVWNIWEYLGVSGSVWQCLTSYGSITCDCLGTSGFGQKLLT